ncbi:hypothetical protein PCASD_11593 [Puccinia coronata f. sp. avenae]|uniref:Sulfhydryl oxidase n=1 Tax=Puccinia coronata f. sp. avenae TaxID=200324 RepID=A0A2N5U8R8_9BASI|nr:hypothetical protein PCASD_11593 [Puccinia coronata f. sp. avenae]
MSPSTSSTLSVSGTSLPEALPQGTHDDKKREANPGMVLGPDGKPCKACSGFQAWAKQIRRETGGQEGRKSNEVRTRGQTIVEDQADCPVDSSRLGRHTWTLLHTIGAYYPAEQPNQAHRDSVRQLINSLATIYPCPPCASHFQQFISRFPPKMDNRAQLERWLCDAHNEVNLRLGKDPFDCSLVSQRWRDGWEDGHCD